VKLWVTRTAPDAHATAIRLRALGHEPVVAPLLEVRSIGGIRPDLKGVAALAFTSRNGVAAFARLTRRRNLPVYTVGEATAQAAREAGFGAVSSADGALAELVALIALHPPKGRLLWPGAAEPAGDLAAAVAAHGVECLHLPVYETVESAIVAPSGIDGVLVHSPRAARVLAGRMSAEAAAPLGLFAISRHAAQPLSHLPFRFVEIADRPDETALLDLTVKPIGANQRTMTTTEPATPGPASKDNARGAGGAVPNDPSAYRPKTGVSRPMLVVACLASVVFGVAISKLVLGGAPAPEGAEPRDPVVPWFNTAPRAETPAPDAAPPVVPFAPVAPSGEVADLSARIARLETEQRRTASAAGAALATTALLQAAQTSRPFTAELAAVEALLPQAETSALRRLAQTGAPTRAMLADEFAAAAAEAASAARAPGKDAGPVAQLSHALSKIVTIRRIEGGTGSDAIIIRAERLVRDGDLEGALVQMGRLPAPARTAFAQWIARAEPRIELDRRLASVRAASIRALAASGQTS
jgi:uroporphyrinogen-III synthase